MAAAKYLWVCPSCKREFKLRERVTVSKRYCPTCKIEITTDDIDRQMRQRAQLDPLKIAMKEGQKKIASDLAIVNDNTVILGVRLDAFTNIRNTLAHLMRFIR